MPRGVEAPALKVLRILRDYRRPLPKDFLARMAEQDLDALDRQLGSLQENGLIRVTGDIAEALPVQK
jgi:hypothetical protein